MTGTAGFPHWALVVTHWEDEGLRAYCPVQDVEFGSPSVIFGMTLITDKPDGEVIAVVHEDGQEAVEAWIESHPAVMAEVFGDRFTRDESGGGKHT